MIHAEPEAACVTEEPEWKKDSEGQNDRHGDVVRREAAKAKHRVSDRADERRESVVEIDRTEEEAWLTIVNASTLAALRMRSKETPENLAFAAHGAPQTQRAIETDSEIHFRCRSWEEVLAEVIIA